MRSPQSRRRETCLKLNYLRNGRIELSMGALGGQRREGPVPSEEKTVGTPAAGKSGSQVERRRKGVSSRVFKSKDIFFSFFLS